MKKLFAKNPETLDPNSEFAKKLINIQTTDGILTLLELYPVGHLTKLDLSDKAELVNDELLNYITKNIPRLEELNLSGCKKITNISVKNIEFLEKLKNLNLSNCAEIVDDKLLNYITKNFYTLEELNLSGCETITNNSVKNIKFLRKLKNLNLSYCPNIDFETVGDLDKLLPLEVLDITGCTGIPEEICGRRTRAPERQLVEDSSTYEPEQKKQVEFKQNIPTLKLEPMPDQWRNLRNSFSKSSVDDIGEESKSRKYENSIPSNSIHSISTSASRIEVTLHLQAQDLSL